MSPKNWKRGKARSTEYPLRVAYTGIDSRDLNRKLPKRFVTARTSGDQSSRRQFSIRQGKVAILERLPVRLRCTESEVKSGRNWLGEGILFSSKEMSRTGGRTKG